MKHHPIAGASIPIPESTSRSLADDTDDLIAILMRDTEEASPVTPHLDTLLRSDLAEIIFERARPAYFQRFGAQAAHPSASGSEFDAPNIFVLSNARGELTRYRVKFTGTGRDVAASLRYMRGSAC